MPENLRIKRVSLTGPVRDVPLGQVVKETPGPVDDNITGWGGTGELVTGKPGGGLKVKRVRI